MGKKKMLMRKFGSVAIVNNTFIGGVASVINTPALLAAKLQYYPSGEAFSENDIQNFTIVGSDIECYIGVDYQINGGAFYLNSSNIITFYKDLDHCKRINIQAFRFTPNLEILEMPHCLAIGGASIASLFESFFAYFPRITDFGGTVFDDNVFDNNQNNQKLYINSLMEIINSGNPDGDILDILTRGNTVAYVTNFDKPNKITDLAVNTVYATYIKLDLSVPSSTNAIDYYEVYVDGIFYENSSTNEIIVAGLTNLQTYNFSVIAVDIFYNKSEMSNVVTQQINGVGREWLENIISYYKFENNVLDTVGTNNGIATDITYASGQVGNAAVFNGSTSKIQLPDTILSTPEFSIVFLVKLNTTSGEQRVISFSDNLSGAYTSIRLNIGGVANRIGVLVYDGVDATPKTVDGYNLTEWHSIILTAKSNDNYKLYVDGILEIEDNNFGNFTTVSGGNYLGAIRTGISNFINGSMDDTAFLNKILSQAEVTEIDTLLMAGFPLI